MTSDMAPPGWLEPYFQLKLGTYTLFCSCSSASVSDELSEELGQKKIKRARPKLVRKPSDSAVSLGRELSNSNCSIQRCPDSGTSSLSLRTSPLSTIGEGNRYPCDSEVQEEIMHIDIDDIEEVKAFKAAVNIGRFIEAAHELHRLEAAGVEDHHHDVVFDPIIVERVNRIADRYQYSLGMFERRLETFQAFERCPEERLEWGFEIKGDIMKFIFIRDEPDLDIMLGFAGMQERDLQCEFNHSILRVNTLGVPNSNDNWWHSFSYSKTTKVKNDTVNIISGLDSLDELSALWGAMYTPTDEACKVNNVKIPPPEEGHSRPSSSFQAWSLRPHKQSGDRTHGFSFRMVSDIKLPAVVVGILKWMPSMMLKGVARSQAAQKSRDFHNWVVSSKALRERLKFGPRASFYAELRERLGGHQKAHPGSG